LVFLVRAERFRESYDWAVPQGGVDAPADVGRMLVRSNESELDSSQRSCRRVGGHPPLPVVEAGGQSRYYHCIPVASARALVAGDEEPASARG
jgi:hypothetical protein